MGGIGGGILVGCMELICGSGCNILSSVLGVAISGVGLNGICSALSGLCGCGVGGAGASMLEGICSVIGNLGETIGVW